MAMAATCGASLCITCATSVAPRKGCRPLSTRPMRVPRPPASIRPVILLFKDKLSPDVRHFNFFRARFQAAGIDGAEFGITVAAGAPQIGQHGGYFFVAAAFAQQRAQIVAAAGEQAGVQLALGGQARARAVLAEGLGDAGN